jgi:hypothetical protein
MAYTVFQHDTRFSPRKGLEVPLHYPSGAVLYYDPKEGEYYDPQTDFYVDRADVAVLQQQIIDCLTQKSL